MKKVLKISHISQENFTKFLKTFFYRTPQVTKKIKKFFSKLLLLPIFYFQCYADFIKVIGYVNLLKDKRRPIYEGAIIPFLPEKYHCLIFEV